MKRAMQALAIGCAAFAATPVAAAEGTIKIATWNLEHLAATNGTGCRPREDADYAKLRSYADRLDADVVGFQEVETEGAAARVFDPARYDIVMSGQPYPSPSGGCRGKDGLKLLPQRTGFAIKKSVAYAVNPPLEALNTNREGGPLRWGVDITIEGKRPIRILNVHLKSGCPKGAKPSDDDCPVLFRQAPIVEDWIDARERASETFLAIGDFNRILDPNDSEVWLTWDDLDPAGLDLHVAAHEAVGGPISPACNNGRYKEFIDHIVMSDRAAKRWDRSSFRELVYEEVDEQRPSDHCPVAITITR
jgi:exonuclease III